MNPQIIDYTNYYKIKNKVIDYYDIDNFKDTLLFYKNTMLSHYFVLSSDKDITDEIIEILEHIYPCTIMTGDYKYKESEYNTYIVQGHSDNNLLNNEINFKIANKLSVARFRHIIFANECANKCTNENIINISSYSVISEGIFRYRDMKLESHTMNNIHTMNNDDENDTDESYADDKTTKEINDNSDDDINNKEIRITI